MCFMPMFLFKRDYGCFICGAFSAHSNTAVFQLKKFENKIKGENIKIKNIHNKQNKFAKGFTLLELLVVVVIIGVLAAIALPQYKYVVAKAKFTQLLTATKAIVEAQRRYMLLYGERSLDLSALDIDIQGGTYGPGLYSNANMKDQITFDWGKCGIINNAARNAISCYISKPYVQYFNPFESKYIKTCCASNESGEIGKKLCQAEFPKAIGKAADDYCGAGGTIYEGH